MTVQSKDTLTEALFCALRGWRVFPTHSVDDAGDCSCGLPSCRNVGKHPIGRLVPNGLKDATVEPATITKWWTIYPTANLAIVTGRNSGIVVLDVDPKHGGDQTLADLEQAHSRLPQTVEAITGSGGRHVYFKHPAFNLPNSAGKVGPGLDIRGDGGYVVAPPSNHVSGGQYQWEISSHPADVQLADMPQWLLELAAGPQQSRNGHQPGAQTPTSGLPISKPALEFVANGAPIGQQRDRAVRAARSYLGAGYSVQDTTEAIWRGLQASACGDPAHPWARQDALDIVQDLASRPAPAPSPLAKQPDDPPDPTLPKVYSSCQDLGEITADCWKAITRANVPPKYFRFGGVPSRVEADDHGAPVIRELTADRLRHELARIANWKNRKLINGNWAEFDAKPPLDVMKDVLATPDPPLPVLSRIVEVPVFAADGSLQTQPGYHAAARTYYSPAQGLSVPDVPVSPSQEDVTKARDTILEVLADFPFVAEADCAHAVALFLLPFVRDMINGPTPNHLIEAPTAGCGKGLLGDVLLMPSVSNHVGVVTQPKDDDELRKRLTAQFREGRSAVLLDNVNQLDSGTLAAALTAITWDDRVLGKTEMLSLSVRCAWVTTANNPTMSTEIARRCVRIRLDPRVDRPWQREGFRYPNLRGWVGDHRAELVWSALTLAKAWLRKGKPAPQTKPLGSFEQWTLVIGGILETSGIPGFLANLNEFYEASDVEGQVWRQFVVAWWDKFHENEVGAAALFPLALQTDCFELGKGTERSQRTMFGKMLGRQRDRVIGDYRIVQTGVSHKAKNWRLLPTKNLFGEGYTRGTWGTLGNVSISPPTHEGGNQNIEEYENVPQRSQCSPDPLPFFEATDDWQDLPENVTTPNGCEYRLNMTTGKRQVRLDPRLTVPHEQDVPLDEPEPDYYSDDCGEKWRE